MWVCVCVCVCKDSTQKFALDSKLNFESEYNNICVCMHTMIHTWMLACICMCVCACLCEHLLGAAIKQKIMRNYLWFAYVFTVLNWKIARRMYSVSVSMSACVCVSVCTCRFFWVCVCVCQCVCVYSFQAWVVNQSCPKLQQHKVVRAKLRWTSI